MSPFRAGLAVAAAAFALSMGASVALAQAPLPYCGPKLYERFPLPRPFGPALTQATCRPYVVEAPAGVLNLAVALNDADRARGLMNVRSLPENTGMLFAFPDGDRPRSFWMKNTLVPLDMIFIESSGRITAIFEDVPSSTFETPDDKVAQRRAVAAYVVELPAGDAKHTGLRVGLRLALPTVVSES